MITQYSITATSWTQISTAGQSGTCWLDDDDDGAKGQVDVRVFHGSSAPGDGDVTKGKRIFKAGGNRDVCILEADDAQDVYYARCRNTGDTATLSVDMP